MGGDNGCRVINSRTTINIALEITVFLKHVFLNHSTIYGKKIIKQLSTVSKLRMYD